jgi:hypothetical protein
VRLAGTVVVMAAAAQAHTYFAERRQIGKLVLLSRRRSLQLNQLGMRNAR